MAPGPITSGQIDGEKEEALTDLILGGSKITAEGDFTHEIFFPWKESYDQSRQRIIKQRYHFIQPKTVHIVKAMVFPIVRYGWES